MIENYLLQIGMKCGTVKNFATTINTDLRLKGLQHWYFLTPVKVSEKNDLLKEANLNLAFPFIATREDISEEVVLKRLALIIDDYKTELLKNLGKMLLIPNHIFTIIPFWANEKGERNERKDFAQGSIHILNAQLTVRYRDGWFKCHCN